MILPKKLNINDVRGWLFVIYVSLSSITTLPLWSMYQIQMQELVFILLFPLCLGYFQTRKFTRLDVCFALYLLVFAANVLIHRNKDTGLESVGTFYLVSMAFLWSRFLAEGKNMDIFMPRALKGMLWVAIGTGVAGFLLHLSGVYSGFGHIYVNYPYFGDIWRLDGLTWCNLLLSCLALASFFYTSFEKDNKTKLFVLALAVLIAALTVSKEIIVYIVLLAACIYWLHTEQLHKSHLFMLTGVLSVTMIVSTFFVFRPETRDIKVSAVSNESQVEYRPLTTVGGIAIHGTTYYYMAQSAIHMFHENPFGGIGSGRFMEKLNQYKENQLYPAKLEVYDTHDFYWGQLAETGMAYLIFLFFFLYEVYQLIKNRPGFANDVHVVLSVSMVFFLVTFLVGGSKHYRHFWVFLGIVNGYLLKKRVSELAS